MLYTTSSLLVSQEAFLSVEAYDGNYSAASDIFAVGVIGYRRSSPSAGDMIVCFETCNST